METPMEILLDKLKSSGEAIHIDNVDITWDFNNSLLMLNQKLSILLTKTSCLPIIPDFTNEDIINILKIEEGTATTIQNFNEQLILIHGIVQKYCIQQYIVGSILKKLMDDIVESLPETNIENLLEFIKNYDELKTSNLKGGNPFKEIARFIKTIVYFLFLLCIVSSTTENEKAILDLTLVDPKNNQYSLGILNYTPEQFTRILMEIEPMTSLEMKLNNIISKYDDSINRELKTVIGKIKSIISTPEFGNLRLESFLGSLNEELRFFSREVEKTCISLMSDAKEKGIFENYALIDSIDETKEKLEHIDDEIEKSTTEIKKGIIGSVSGVAVSLANSDTLGTAAYLTSTVGYLYDYVSDLSKSKVSKKQVLQEQKSLIEATQPSGFKPTKTERLEFESKLFVFSQLYCSMGFNLQIGLQNDTIQIIGDKVPYMAMINLITTLEQNLSIEIDKLSSQQPMTESIQNTVLSLDSLQQRLSVLKEITNYLNNIVNFSSELQIMKMTKYPSPQTLIELEEYLTDQLNQLNSLLQKLYKKFPIKDKTLDETKELIEEEIELQSKQMNISDLIQNATSIARQRAADRASKENQEWWLATKTIAQSYMDIGLNGTFFAKDNFKKYTGAFIDLAAQGPLEVVNGIMRFLNEVLFSLVSNPAGWCIILAGLFIVEFTVGGVSGTIRIFKSGGKFFIAIATGSIIFIYELIKTPFGYVYRQIATMRVIDAPVIVPQIQNADQYGQYGEANYQAFLAQQEEGEEYNHELEYANRGGKRRSKGRKTRKHKKRRTKKIKNGKRRHTRHRNVRSTKRH